MRSHSLSLLAAALLALAVSACGGSGSSHSSTGNSGSSPTSTGSSTSSTASTGSSTSSTASTGGSGSSAPSGGGSLESLRSTLEQEIASTAGVKAAEAKKIVDCILARLSSAGIKTEADAASHQSELSNFSAKCAEQVVAAGG